MFSKQKDWSKRSTRTKGQSSLISHTKIPVFLCGESLLKRKKELIHKYIQAFMSHLTSERIFHIDEYWQDWRAASEITLNLIFSQLEGLLQLLLPRGRTKTWLVIKIYSRKNIQNTSWKATAARQRKVVKLWNPELLWWETDTPYYLLRKYCIITLLWISLSFAFDMWYPLLFGLLLYSHTRIGQMNSNCKW